MAQKRASGELADATARKIAIVIELLRARRLDVDRFQKDSGLSQRQMLRDLQELRGLGKTLGFSITGRKNGTVELAEFAGRPGLLVKGEQTLNALIVELFKAFGAPLQPYAAGITASTQSAFVRVVMPHLIEGTSVAEVLAALQSAWENDARVRFKYKGKEREVEPALTMVRSGRYYLVGRQVDAGAGKWRIFSMDEIKGPIRRCGTFKPQTPPDEYTSTDTVGWIKTGKKQSIEVTISKSQAHTATSRQWQTAQTSRENTNGSWTIAFEVGDIDEVIRWALGFGEEAWITAPPAAVTRAKQIVQAVARRYD